MFYEKEEISELLICAKCKLTFNEPCALPCGENICKTCIDGLFDPKTNGIVCHFCSEFHAVPKDGLPASMIILKLLTKKSSEVYRNKTVESLKSYLNEINSATENLVQIINRSEFSIKEYCDFVRHDVQLVTDSAYEYIDKFREKFMSEIEVYERNCLSNSDKLFREKQFSPEFVTREMNEFIEEQIKYLRKFLIDDTKVEQALDKAKLLKKQLDVKSMQVKSQLFNGKKLVFEENTAVLESNILGKLSLNYLERPETCEFDTLQHLDLDKIVTNMQTFHSIHLIGGEKFNLFYSDVNGYLSQARFDRDGKNVTYKKLYSERSKRISGISVFVSCKREKDIFCFFSFNETNKNYHESWNEYNEYNSVHMDQLNYLKAIGPMKETQTMQIDFNLSCLASNKMNIFGTEESSICVFDSDLEFIKTIDSTNRIKKLEASDDRLFVLDNYKQLTIIKLSDETSERKLAFAYDNLIYHLDSFIVSFDNQSNNLIWYDMNCKTFETKMVNCLHGNSIVDSSIERLVFFNSSSRVLSF